MPFWITPIEICFRLPVVLVALYQFHGYTTCNLKHVRLCAYMYAGHIYIEPTELVDERRREEIEIQTHPKKWAPETPAHFARTVPKAAVAVAFAINIMTGLSRSQLMVEFYRSNARKLRPYANTQLIHTIWKRGRENEREREALNIGSYPNYTHIKRKLARESRSVAQYMRVHLPKTSLYSHISRLLYTHCTKLLIASNESLSPTLRTTIACMRCVCNKLYMDLRRRCFS